MPKFLDKPQWYDDDGKIYDGVGFNTIEITGTMQSISFSNLSPGFYKLKWNGGELSSGTVTIDWVFSISVMLVTNFSYRFVNQIDEIYFHISQTSILNIFGHENAYTTIRFFNLYPSIQPTGTETSLSSSVLLEFTKGVNTVLEVNDSAGTVTWINNGPIFININGANSVADGTYSFYAPVTPGSAGQMLFSGGTSNVPVWQTINLNGVPLSTQSGFYAPTSNPAGGNILQSTGFGAPSWTSFMVNGAALGTTGNTSIYAPTTNSTTNGYAVAWVGGKPQWRPQVYAHNLHLYFDGQSSGNSLIFTALLRTEESMEAYSDRLNILSNLVFNQYNNCTISATGRTSAGGVVIGVAALNISQFSITEITQNGGHNTITRDIETFGLVRDYVFPIIGARADYDMN